MNQQQTQQTPTRPQAPTAQTAQIPEELHEEANDLIRDLAAVAGDEAVVTQKIRASLPKNKEDAFALLAAALIVIFSECITAPTEAGAYAKTSMPSGPNGGAR